MGQPARTGRGGCGPAGGLGRCCSARGRRLPHTSRRGGRVSDARLSPDGRFVLTVSSKGAAVWNVRTGARLRTLPVSGAVSVARFSPDGKEIVTGGSNGHVKLWRTLGSGPINS